MNKYALACCLFVTGCATHYQSSTFSPFGGYSDSQVNEKLQKIVFSGNGYTDPVTAVKYAKFQCAEYAEKHDKPYFLLYTSLRNAAFDVTSIMPNSGSVGGKPAAFAYVRLIDEEIPGAIKTSDVIGELNEFRASNQKKSSNNSKNKVEK